MSRAMLKRHWTVAPEWQGETAWIIAGGTSVKALDLSRLEGRHVVAVNSSYEAAPFAQYLFFGDERWWNDHRGKPGIRTFKGKIVTPSQAAVGNGILRLRRVTPNMDPRKGKSGPGLSNNPQCVVSQRTSLHGAMNFAKHLGVKRIVLVGADMCRGADGKTHHHTPHKWKNKPGNKTWDIQVQQLQYIVAPLRECGIEVFNASPISRLPDKWGWPKVSFESALAGVWPAVPPCDFTTEDIIANEGTTPMITRRKNGWAGGIMDDDAAMLRKMVKDHNIKSVLEFGPGYSTQVFLNAGVERITACEHEPRWRETARKLYANEKRVTILPYANTPIVVVNLEGQTFDAAFVDSPQGYAKARVVHPGQEGVSRYNTLCAALVHAPIVFLHDAKRSLEQAALARIAAEGRGTFEMLNTSKGIARVIRSGVAKPDFPIEPLHTPDKSAGNPAKSKPQPEPVRVEMPGPNLSVALLFWKAPRREWQKYTHNVVNVLARSISRNLKTPHEIVVFTDQSTEGFDSNLRLMPVNKELIPIANAYPKLVCFKPDVQMAKRILFLDLDTVVCGPLDPVIDRPEPIVLLPEFLRSPRHCYYNTSVMLLDRGAAPQVWTKFIANPKGNHAKVRATRKVGSDQLWVSETLGPDVPTWKAGDRILSFKYHVRNRWLPENASIVCFHGKFKPWDASVQKANSWIVEHWR
jgi:hypothetical protein